MPQKYNLPPQVAEAMEGYFRLRLAGVGRGRIGEEARHTHDQFIKDCHFVYIANSGSVLHSEWYCSGAYSLGPVPFNLAFEKGYRTPCPKCAKGTYIETLLREKAADQL